MWKWSILKIAEHYKQFKMSNICNEKKKSTYVKHNTHYLKNGYDFRHICLLTGVSPWSKYVPMPPTQKGPTRLFLTHLWRFVEGWSRRFQKVSAGPRATRRVRWTKDVQRVCFRLFNRGREQKSEGKKKRGGRLAGIYFLECDVKAFSMQRTM